MLMLIILIIFCVLLRRFILPSYRIPSGVDFLKQFRKCLGVGVKNYPQKNAKHAPKVMNLNSRRFMKHIVRTWKRNIMPLLMRSTCVE